jgi:hypothetical protein
MPVKNAVLKQTTLAAHKQLSYEQLLSAWLLSDGWEVLIPVIDHGKKTDLVVADDDELLPDTGQEYSDQRRIDPS